MLLNQTHGREVLKVINPPPGLFERVALRVRSSFRLTSVPEVALPVPENGGDSDQEGLPAEYLEVVSVPF